MSKVLNDSECIPFETPWRSATVLEIVDADTLDVKVDLGFDVHVTARVRLVHLPALTFPKIGFNAWEVRGEQRDRGIAAKGRAAHLCPVGSRVRMQSRKGGTRESLGRWLACILVKSLSVDGWESLGDILLAEGHGDEWWDGKADGKKRPSG